MPNLGVIILAAGGSTRMGQPKQLLKIKGKTLIRKTVEMALAVDTSAVVVVLGNAFEEIQLEIADLNVTIAQNNNWHEGMAGSLRIGIQKILETKVQSVLVLVCDQPHISADYLKKMDQSFQASGQLAIASLYNTIKGVPAIFDIEVLKKLHADQGDFGARHLIKQLDRENKLAVVDFPEGAIDLDTPEDFERFVRK